MAMKRSQKETLVSELAKTMQESPASFLVSYQGSTVEALQAFRTKLREQDARFRVAKARLFKIAAQEVPGGPEFAEQFKEQVGMVFSGQDVGAVAKELVGFAKKNESIKVVSGFYESQVLSEDQVKYFASLPSREVLLAQVVGTMQAPIATFVRLLSMLITRLLYVLQRIAEQKEAQAGVQA